MKLVLVLCACVVGSLAGFIQPFATGAIKGATAADLGKYGSDSLKASDLLRDAGRVNAAADLWTNAGQQSARRSNNYGDEASHDASRQQASRQGHGQNAAAWDQNEDQSARAAARDQQWAQHRDQLALQDAADRAAANNLWAQGNQFRQGRRNHDSIDYGFDKKFATNNHEDGGYEYSESSDSHALDDYANKKTLYGKKKGAHAAQAAKADAQSAERWAASANQAAAAAANSDKFGRDYDSAAWANGANKDLSQKLDASQAGNRYWSDARERALDAYADLAARDSNAARQSGAYGDVDGKLGAADYGYGLAGAKGFAPKPGAYPRALGAKGIAAADYAKQAGAADLAKLWDQSQEQRLKKAEKESTKDEAKSSFTKDQWLNDRVQGYNKDSAAKANDHGFSDFAKKAEQSAAAYDAKSADAASKSAAQQARFDLDENIQDAESRRRNLSNRKANKKVNKKFFHNNHNGGDNWERLNYDRDQVDDVFGYRAGIKKDQANRAAASHSNHKYDANARKADAARAADRASAASLNDWRKSADGWNAAQAARAQAANAEQRGLRNDNYKNNVEQQAFDDNRRLARAYDRGADRYGVDQAAYGKNIGAYGRAVNAGYPYVGAGGNAFGAARGFGAYPGYGVRGYAAGPVAGYGYGGYSKGGYAPYGRYY
ncbi:hypothetical protein RRG08_037751 [Elysia crispata]|uniref:Uncharacterized protein n=1 Tax=Elysia crispata TaxID=231223 RepID=A0AAE1A836_9GAST|nr:hypothetical protein RRG08_037751 [Elysia crispata]